MSWLRNPSALLLGSSLALVIFAAPGAASADDTTGATATQLTPAELTAALSLVQTATVTAETPGWSQWTTYSDQYGALDRIQIAYDPTTGRAKIADPSVHQTEIVVSHKGAYETLPAFGSVKRLERVLDVIGRPEATWIYEPDATIDLEQGPFAIAHDAAPDILLGLLADTDTTTITGTSTITVAEDGTTTYAVPVTTTDGSVSSSSGPVTETGLVTLSADASGVLKTADIALSEEDEAKTFAYGAQKIALPKWSGVVTKAQVNKGRPLLRVAADIKETASIVAHEVVKSPHRGWSAVHIIRTAAADLVRIRNRKYHQKDFTVRNIPRGVRITATNPFTRATIAYIVTSAGHGKVANISRV